MTEPAAIILLCCMAALVLTLGGLGLNWLLDHEFLPGFIAVVGSIAFGAFFYVLTSEAAAKFGWWSA